MRVEVGRDILENTGSILSKHLFCGDIAVLTGPTVGKRYISRLEESLREGGFTPAVFTVGDSSLRESARIVVVLPRNTCAIVGFGGGRILDTAKMVAHSTNLNFISIPTSAAHDGIASPQASLKGLNGAHSVRVKTPFIIIADSALIAQSPKALTLSGIGDVLAKFSSVLDSRLAQERGEYVGDYAISLAEMSAKLVFDNMDRIVSLEESGIRTLLEALISNGIAMAIAGSSRPCSGSEHMFGHAFDYLTSHRILHGYTVLLGCRLSLALHGQDWERILIPAEVAGIPCRGRDFEVPSVYVERALAFASKIRPERYTILASGISLSRASEVVRKTGAI